MRPAEHPAALDPTGIDLDRGELLRLYRTLRLTRTFETRLAHLYRQGRILGAVYLGTGQEAIAAGVADRMAEGDLCNTVSRSLAAWFLRGVEPREVLARWLGRDVPPAHGRELGLFLADLDRGLAPFHNGSMGAWIPSGAGFALAFRLRRESRVYVAFTGDGATSPGDFYEGLGFAAIHRLPLVVVAENNGYAYSTPVERQMPVRRIVDRAAAFGIAAERVPGNDLFAVLRAADRALAHARSGCGPVLLECVTFRRRGHGEHDDASYVPEAVRRYWEERDPIRLYETYLTTRAGIEPAELAAIDDACRALVDEAVEWAESRPWPAPETAATRLYAPRRDGAGPAAATAPSGSRAPRARPSS